jgi:hypothetical protein
MSNLRPFTEDMPMSLHLITRITAAVAVAASSVAFMVADVKGDYNVEFVVEGNAYTGTIKTTPVASAKGQFTGKLELTAPSSILGDAKGKTVGDSVIYDITYEDKGRGCTGTLAARGTIEKDGSKAAGAVNLNDSCGGPISGTFRLWR